MRTHTRMHTRMHTRTHTQTHARMHTHTHTHTHTDSDSDIETYGENEEPGLPLSPDSHLISHKKGGKMRANLDSKERGRKGGHGKGKVSIEEMIQKQETASQIHNENERYR